MCKLKPLLFFWIPFVLISFLIGGCTTNNNTNPPRSATEQLLLSTAADHALKSARLSVFANQKVFLDTTYFDSYDSKYALGAVRDALSQQGAVLEEFRTNCDIVVEVRSGALSIDNSTFLFGIPSIGAPIPFTGGIQTPELAFYKSQKQNSFAKFAMLAYSEIRDLIFIPAAHWMEKHTAIIIICCLCHGTTPTFLKNPNRMKDAPTNSPPTSPLY